MSDFNALARGADVPIRDQIAELVEEQEWRRGRYRDLVRSGRMRQENATMRLARIGAAIETLRQVQRTIETLRQVQRIAGDAPRAR
jgi:hypothetical protein